MKEEQLTIGALIGGGGKLLLAAKPYSSHPGDAYLLVVLCKWDDQWVTWIYNTQTSGTVEGHYGDSFEVALADFNKRGAK